MNKIVVTYKQYDCVYRKYERISMWSFRTDERVQKRYYSQG